MSDIVPFLNTTFDRDLFLQAIDFLLSGLYSTKGAAVTQLSQNGTPSEMTEYLEKTVTALKGKHPNEVRRVLLELKDEVSEIPVLKVTLAFNPQPSFTSYLSSFFTSALKKKVIIAVSIEENMVSGIRFETKGLYRDFSLSKVMDLLFSEHKEEIVGMLG